MIKNKKNERKERMKKMRKSVKIVCCFAVAMLLVNGVSASELSTITVTSQSSVTSVPDKAEISLGVNTEAASPAEAQAQNTEIVDQIIAACLEQGVDEKNLKTSNYDLFPLYDYDYDGGEDILRGYRVSTTLLISDQDLAGVGELISVCVANGANFLSNVAYKCSDYDACYSQALAQAVGAAEEKAKVLAAAAGKELSGIASITEGYQNTALQYKSAAIEEFAMDSASGNTSSVSLMPGESEISANLTVVYYMD